ncbi:MAG: hypothetical protein ACMV0Y_00010 [Paludibacter sp.]
MKANGLLRLAVLFIATVTAITIKAQTPVHCCTVVEVTDGNYSDKLWMITEPGTTNGFDNGWDGYKFLSSATYIPQLYDKTVDGNFQVSSFPSIENKFFAFRPGSATQYTLKFTHYDITYFYPALYLVDVLKGDTVNVYENKSTYTFTASSTDVHERFKFITKLADKPVTPPSLPDTTEVPVINQDTLIVIPPAGGEQEGLVDPSGSDPSEDEMIGNNGPVLKKDNLAAKVSVYVKKSVMVCNNPNKQVASLKMINTRTGRVEKEIVVGAGAVTTTQLTKQKGLYLIQISVQLDVAATSILVQ